MAAIIDYLTENEPGALAAAKEAYRCFEPYGRVGQSYALGTAMVPETCEEEMVALLREIRGQSRAAGDLPLGGLMPGFHKSHVDLVYF